MSCRSRRTRLTVLGLFESDNEESGGYALTYGIFTQRRKGGLQGLSCETMEPKWGGGKFFNCHFSMVNGQ